MKKMMTKTMNKAMCRLCALLILFCISIACACCGNDSPTPRRYAYPRVATYPQKYVALSDMEGLNIEVNSFTQVLTDSVADSGSHWITLSYPKYKSNLYITVNKCNNSSQIQDVITNRVQRISLNTGGKDFEQVDLENDANFKSKIFTVRGGNTNPVMFLSSNQKNYVISGVLYILDDNAVTKADSIAPIIDAVSNDIIHLTQNLR